MSSCHNKYTIFVEFHSTNIVECLGVFTFRKNQSVFNCIENEMNIKHLLRRYPVE